MQIKRVLCIQDFSCVGRCSLAVALPILSAAGVQACALPTALFSTHTMGFGAPAVQAENAFCLRALAHWQTQEICFDAVYSGYLAQEPDAEIVRAAWRQNPHALRVLDPAMADDGKLYSSISPALASTLCALAKEADVLTPNATESAVLLGLTPTDHALTEAQWQERARQLLAAFPRLQALVITGVRCAENGTQANLCATRTQTVLLPFDSTGVRYPGTGDVFASALTGALLRGVSLTSAVQLTADFIALCACKTQLAGAEPRFGVLFEPHLAQLTQEINKAGTPCPQ